MSYRLIITLAVGLWSFGVFAQGKADSARVISLIHEAGLAIQGGDSQDAINKLNSASNIASQNDMPSQKALALQALGNVHNTQENYYQSIQAYLHAAMLFEGSNQYSYAIIAYTTVGHIYYKLEAYGKAADYYQMVMKHAATDPTLKKRVGYHLGDALSRLGAQQDAISVFERLSIQEEKDGNKSGAVRLALLITESYISLSELRKAESSCIRGLQLIGNDRTQTWFKLQNALIFLYNRGAEFGKAQGIVSELTKYINETTPPKEKGIFFINAGVTYSNLKQHSQAKEYFTDALSYYKSKDDKAGVASMMNYLAADYYLAGIVSRALEEVEIAIETANSANALDELAIAYQLKERILADNHATSKAKETAEDLTDIKKRISQDSVNTIKTINEIKSKADRNDKAIRERIALREQEARAFRQFRNEAERRESELKLLKQSQELQKVELENQKLEKEKIDQMYALLQSKARADELEKNREIQELQLKQKEVEEQKRMQQIKLLEQEKAFGELKLEEEKKQKRYAMGATGLVVLILIGVILALVTLRKRNRKIKQQNQKIGEQKEELEQQTEELMQQRSELESQKDVLSFQNSQITASINYAQTIQASILPNLTEVSKAFEDIFVLFRPKDVVSGDFYWFFLDESSKVRYISAVDCTGHGVPGAFMSLIGSRVLDELIINKSISEPNIILEELDSTIRSSLRQVETENRDGMDLVFCRVEYQNNGDAKIYFAGAKRPLIYHDIVSNKIETLKGSRRSIGGAKYSGKSKFDCQEILLKKGSTVYLTSDGYIDQNGSATKKLGTPRFLEILNDIKGKSLEEQNEHLSAFFDQHRGGKEQRDDVTIVAFRI